MVTDFHPAHSCFYNLPMKHKPGAGQKALENLDQQCAVSNLCLSQAHTDETLHTWREKLPRNSSGEMLTIGSSLCSGPETTE